MGLGDCVHDNMYAMIDDLLKYDHATTAKNSKLIRELIAQMHFTIGRLDWDTDGCTLEQSRNAARELWFEKIDELNDDLSDAVL